MSFIIRLASFVFLSILFYHIYVAAYYPVFILISDIISFGILEIDFQSYMDIFIERFLNWPELYNFLISFPKLLICWVVVSVFGQFLVKNPFHFMFLMALFFGLLATAWTYALNQGIIPVDNGGAFIYIVPTVSAMIALLFCKKRSFENNRTDISIETESLEGIEKSADISKKETKTVRAPHPDVIKQKNIAKDKKTLSLD